MRDLFLREAARLWGVELSHRSAMDGNAVPASDRAVLAVLRELGAPIEGPGDLGDAVRAARADRWSRLVEPVAVCWDGAAPTVAVRLPSRDAEEGVGCELAREDGGTVSWRARPHDLLDPRPARIDGHDHVLASLSLPDLPHGIHELTVRTASGEGRVRIVRAPRRAWTPEREGAAPPREWGVFLPTYALRTDRSPGLADLTDLRGLQRWTAARGGSLVGTLPLLASFLDRPFDPSPYAPASRLFWNELYLDPARVPGFDRAEATRALLDSPEYRREGERLRRADTVDYRAAMVHRRRALATLAGEIAPAGEPLPEALAAFAAARPEAETYAAFRALAETHGGGWPHWPAELHAGSADFRDLAGRADGTALRVHLVAQWAMDLQLLQQAHDGGVRHEEARLYMDLPLGCHPDGYDPWRWPDRFADASAGAPPDLFFREGQDWGFQPPHPQRARAEGHDYWIASLRHVMRASALLRLDHVMALHRLYWIPRGLPSSEGVYVRYPAEELYAILCLESHRHRTEIVGEDLGTVPPEVRAAMDAHALRRMFVVPFELDPEQAELPAPPANAVASVGTHDLPPFRGFLEGRDLGDRPEAERVARREWTNALGRAVATEAAPGPLLEATLGRLAESPARLLLVSLEDLWLETEPQNRPGTAGTENWSRKARHTMEEMDRMDGVESLLGAVARARPGHDDRDAS